MAEKINIGGIRTSRPGVYSLVKSGIKNNPTALDYGHVAIIDDGIGAGWGGGDENTVHTFEKAEDFQDYIKGGELWNLAGPLFKPGPGYNGISKLSIIHAREASSAVINFTLANGTIALTTKDKGVNANGVSVEGVLVNGYAGKLVSDIPATTATIAVATIAAAGASVKEKKRVTILNPAIGDQFSIVFGTETITIAHTATTANQLATINAIAAACRANATLNAAYTFEVVSLSGTIVLTIERKVVNVVFALTTSATLRAPKLKLQIFSGSFRGTDPINNIPYELSNVNSKVILVAESKFESKVSALINWANTDATAKEGFIASGTFAPEGADDVVSGDVTANYVLATGALENYSNGALTAARLKAKQLDNSIFLATKFGSEAQHSNNDTLAELAATGSKYKRLLFIGGGATKAEYTTISKPSAIHFDNELVHIVHGDGLKSSGLNSFKRVSSLWKAANIVGRLCGLEVQTPITWKQIDIDAEFDPIDEDQFEDANDSGVLITYKDAELGYTIVQLGINTLQNNDNVVNEADGTSYSIQVVRMKNQLNKELAIFLKKKFFGNQQAGPNRNTVSKEELESATDGFLKDKHATTNKDNYLISHKNIVATVTGVTYKVDYEFTPNFEVSFIIPTGTIIDNN